LEENPGSKVGRSIRWLYLNSYQFILGKGMWKGSSPDPPDFLPTLLPGFGEEIIRGANGVNAE
jgi:hypothetical protein